MPSKSKTRAAVRFSVIAGGVIGVLRSLPVFAAVYLNVGAALVAAAVASIGVLALLWIVIRRREQPLLSGAAQLWGALMVGWVSAAILTHPLAKELAPDVTWGMIALGVGVGLLISPVAIAIGAVIIRLGRLLPGSGKPSRAAIATSESGVGSPVT